MKTNEKMTARSSILLAALSALCVGPGLTAAQHPDKAEPVIRTEIEENRLTFFDAESQRGFDVLGTGNEKLGDISDFVVNIEDSRVTHVLIQIGGFLTFGGDVRALPSELIEWEDGRYTASVSKGAFHDLPPLPDDHSAFFESHENVQQLYDHFDITGEVEDDLYLVSSLRGPGRRAELADGTEIGEVRDLAIDLETNHVGYALLLPRGILLSPLQTEDLEVRYYALPIPNVASRTDDGVLRFDLPREDVLGATHAGDYLDLRIDRGRVYAIPPAGE